MDSLLFVIGYAAIGIALSVVIAVAIVNNSDGWPK